MMFGNFSTAFGAAFGTGTQNQQNPPIPGSPPSGAATPQTIPGVGNPGDPLGTQPATSGLNPATPPAAAPPTTSSAQALGGLAPGGTNPLAPGGAQTPIMGYGQLPAGASQGGFLGGGDLPAQPEAPNPGERQSGVSGGAPAGAGGGAAALRPSGGFTQGADWSNPDWFSGKGNLL